MRLLWDHRNNLLHESDNIVAQQELDNLNRQIRQIYFLARGELQYTEDCYLFQLSMNQVISKDDRYKKEWLITTRIALMAHKGRLGRATRENS